MLFVAGRIAVRSSLRASRWVIARPAPRVLSSRSFTRSSLLNEALATPSSKPTRKRKTASSTKTTAAAPKKRGRKPSKAKKEPKPKPKVKKVKKPLSEKSQHRLDRSKHRKLIADLTEKALIKEEPKGLPISAYRIFVVQWFKENGMGGLTAPEAVKKAAAGYQQLSEREKSDLAQVAAENKAANEVAYMQWIASLTPAQLDTANRARTRLRQEARKANPTKKSPHKFHILKDDRLPKRGLSAWVLYYTDMHRKGEYEGLLNSEAFQAAARAFKSLPESERKPYEDEAAALKAKAAAFREELKKSAKLAAQE